MTRWSETEQPCPCGRSSNAFSYDVKGGGYCFRGDCEKPFFSKRRIDQLKGIAPEDIEEEEVSKFDVDYIPHSGISQKTLKKFGVKVKVDAETREPIDVAFFYPNGAIQIWKWGVRGKVPDKIRTVGDMTNAGVAFRNVFDKGSRKTITITEGNYDALSVYEMIGDTATVAVKSSSTAKSDVQKDFDYINSFERVIICMDGDEAGQAAAKKILPLFDFKKVYNLKLEKHKDANDYLLNGDVADFVKAWNGVKRYTPDNLVATMDGFREALKLRREGKICDYPFYSLNEKLFGLHRGEVIVFKGEEGIGKTEIFRAIENKVLKDTKENIGIIHLEEDNGTTLKGIAGYYTEQPILHPESHVDDDGIMEILGKISGDNDPRFVLHESFDVEDEDDFINSVRFMVVAYDISVVAFDHISWLATGSEDKQEDERKRLDRIAQRLKLLAKELNFCLCMISHVNDDGKTRGSRYITKVANTVINLSRNKMHEDPAERNKTYLAVEKARLPGAKTGPAGYALYDDDKLMLIDPSEIRLEVVAA